MREKTMSCKTIMIAGAFALSAFAAIGETLKIKYITTVDIVEDGQVVGTRKLKPGTLVEVVDASTGDAAKPGAEKGAQPTQGGKLRLSKLSPVMFKTTRQSMAHVFNAEISLSDDYVGPYENRDREFWSVKVYAYNANWDGMEIFYGYAKKTSPVGRQVERELADGANHKCHAKLTYVRNSSLYDNIVLLDSFEFVAKED